MIRIYPDGMNEQETLGIMKTSQIRQPTQVKTGVYPKEKFKLREVAEEVFSRKFGKDVGAVATFLGVARSTGREGKLVTKLGMESYEPHANRVLQEICKEVKEKHELSFVTIIHLLGEFEVGEPVVFVAVGGERRRRVFEGLLEAVERYKREPALFKKEVYSDGSHSWIES
jgi:molybdopterin synthase catalytic subunit